MIISRNPRFLFFAFNKTGSTSVESALARYNSRVRRSILRRRYYRLAQTQSVFKHARPLDIRGLLDGQWDEYYTFSFVRNPWSRLVSLYHYHHSRAESLHHADAQVPFAGWVRAGGTGTAQRSMSAFVSDDQGQQILDFVGRAEQLDVDIAKVCSDLGIARPEIPRLNTSKHGAYRKYFDDELRELVDPWIREDAQRFGYEF